ncbi:MAG TPA: nucleotide exchange factor GrpE [Chthoniobacterales bacterium]|nr:nucleotide exchange factor GrpE [Chthoniobacterales bacterium]
MRRIPVTESPAEDDKSAPNPDPAQPKSEPSGSDVPPSSDQDEDETLQADLDRFRDLALRSQADFENYKKRAAREKEAAIKYANSSLLERLIAIVDNFELGLEAARGEGENSPVFSGMSMVLKQLMDFLTEHGLQPINATGQKFDPNLHEAIAHESSEQYPEGVVIRQTRRGYRMKDRLLRPSSVVVSSGP